MQILSRTSNWLRSQVAAPADDFRQGSSEATPSKKLAVSTAVGSGIGAVTGGGLAYHSVSKDFTYFDYVTNEIPLAASGPEALDVFGGDLGQFQNLVNTHTENAVSSKESLQYLSYLKFQDPKVPNQDLQGIYQSLETQLGEDTQVRQALNMISAHVQKHGSTPNEAYQEFSNYFGYEPDFGKASQTFLVDQKLSPDELNMTTLQMVKRHSSPLGHLGMGKAVALGIATGAAIGAATGLVVGVGINLYDKLIRS